MKINLSDITQKWVNIGWPDVLLPFTSDYNSRLTASEISKKTKTPRRTVARIILTMARAGVLRYVVEGKNKKYYLDKNQRARMLMKFIEDYKAVKFSLNHGRIFFMLEDMIKRNDIVVFGSYAKGIATQESDIDVLVIGRKSQKIIDTVHRHEKEINVHFSTMDEFTKLLKSKNVLAIEIVRNHVNFGNSGFADICWRFYKNDL